MAILSGKKIKEEIENKNIEITNYNPQHINPNSYDVTLSNEAAVYDFSGNIFKHLDMKSDNKIRNFTIPECGFVLEPNKLYLMRTNEKTITNKYAPMIQGRSSVGRLGIAIHVTAGFGDVGFNGYWTLEVFCIHPVKIYPHVRIGQVYFYTLDGDYYLYTGKYQDNNEIQNSMLYKDIEWVQK